MTIEMLSEILEPGETTVYAMRGRSVAVTQVAFGSMVVGTVIFTAVVSKAAWIPLAVIVCAAFLWKSLDGSTTENPEEVVVTDRRLLYRRAGQRGDVTSLPFGEVEGIAWARARGPGALDVASKTTTLALPPMPKPDALALAVTQAIGVPPLEPGGRVVDVDAFVVGSYVAVFGTVFVAVRTGLNEAITVGIADSASWLTFGLRVCAIAAALGIAGLLVRPVGRLLGNLLAVIFMRPVANAEQMRIAIDNGRPHTWQRSVSLRFAGLLYGRELRPEAGNAAYSPRSLDAMIGPGERVLYRLEKPRMSKWEVSFRAAILILFVAISALEEPGTTPLLDLVIILLLPLPSLSEYCGYRDIAVTDRRLLIDPGLSVLVDPRSGPFAIDLSDIEAVAIEGSGSSREIVIEMVDGYVERLTGALDIDKLENCLASRVG